MNCILRGVRVIDPAARLDTAGQDVWLSEGRLIAIYRHIDEGTTRVIDLTPPSGQPPCVLAPAFIDLHTHLREPGGEAAETIFSGASAAAAGGFGQIVAMANTDPPVDTPAGVVAAVARADGPTVRVLPAAAMSRALEGAALVDVAGCAAAGAVAFSDDGRNAASGDLLRDGLLAADDAGRAVLVHPEDEAMLSVAGAPGTRCLERPAEVETSAVRRALGALRAAGRGRLHLQHLSTAESVQLLRQAREDGLTVTAEVTPHHLSMWLPLAVPVEPPALVKVNPPLRDERDRVAIVQALRDGVIDAVATDHAPHPFSAKTEALVDAPPGMTGLETALATCITLGGMDGDWIPVLIERLTMGPERVLGAGMAVHEPRLRVGETASFTLFDPAAEWVVGETPPLSRSRNTPLWGARLRGKVLMTVVGGELAYCDATRLPQWSALVGAGNG